VSCSNACAARHSHALSCQSHSPFVHANDDSSRGTSSPRCSQPYLRRWGVGPRPQRWTSSPSNPLLESATSTLSRCRLLLTPLFTLALEVVPRPIPSGSLKATHRRRAQPPTMPGMQQVASHVQPRRWCLTCLAVNEARLPARKARARSKSDGVKQAPEWVQESRKASQARASRR